MITETVFDIGAEGGGIHIKRQKDQNREYFICHYISNDFLDEGNDIDQKTEFSTFQEAFELMKSKAPQWFMLYLLNIHEDFKNFVTEYLINSLTQQHIKPEDIKYSQKRLEEVLGIKLKYDKIPIKSDLQNISVQNLMKITEYSYENFTEESGKADRIKGKHEIWQPAKDFNLDYFEVIPTYDNLTFTTTGKLEVSGNTIIIKDKFDEIMHIFPSDNFFVSTSPILSKTKDWYYTEN